MRDWGHPEDYAEAMWLMLQQEKAENYVVAMGEAYSVRESVQACFAWIGLEIIWSGKGAVTQQ